MVFHRNPNALATLFIGVFLNFTLLAAAAPLPLDVQHQLEVLKTGFESFFLKTVTTPYEEGLRTLNANAVTALKSRNTAAAQRKDLDGLVRIKADLERLGKGQALTLTDISPPAALASVYAAYKIEYDRLQSSQKLNAADARQRYDKGLAAVQDELTTQQKIDAALHVKQLREVLANNPEDTKPGLASGNSGRAATPLPREWTYHLREGVGRSGTMIFDPDGTFQLTFTNMAKPQHGTWKINEQSEVVIAYTDVPGVGTDPIVLKITGDKAQFDLPSVGIRYLKVKPLGDHTGIAGQWTYHLTRDEGPRGLLTLHQDGRLELLMKLEKEPQVGTWSDTDKTDVIRITFENNPAVGTAPIEVRLSGAEAEMDLPNVGKRYLEFQNGEPTMLPQEIPSKEAKVNGMPAEWTYHTAADATSTGWLRLLPKGVMEWHDRKGIQPGKWQRTADGFELDCLNETWIVKIDNDWAVVNRPSASKHYLRLKLPAGED